MAFTTPGTAEAGAVLTAAFWNTNVRDNTLALRNLSGVVPPMAQISATTGSVTVNTAIAFPTTDFDSDSLVTSSTVITTSIDGVYEVYCAIRLDGSTTFTTLPNFRPIISGSASGPNRPVPFFATNIFAGNYSQFFDLAAGATISMSFTYAGGGTVTFTGAPVLRVRMVGRLS